MSVFKEESETKRVIFNIRLDLAERLEAAKEGGKQLGRKLDVDTTVNEALEKYLKKAEKRIAEMLDKREEFRSMRITSQEPEEPSPDEPENQAAPAQKTETAVTPKAVPGNALDTATGKTPAKADKIGSKATK